MRTGKGWYCPQCSFSVDELAEELVTELETYIAWEAYQRALLAQKERSSHRPTMTANRGTGGSSPRLPSFQRILT